MKKLKTLGKTDGSTTQCTEISSRWGRAHSSAKIAGEKVTSAFRTENFLGKIHTPVVLRTK